MVRGKIKHLNVYLNRKGCTKEFILDLDYTEDEYAEAEAQLCQMA